MRACHPDVAGASMSADEEDDGGTDDVCAFINAAVMEVQIEHCPLPYCQAFCCAVAQTEHPVGDLLLLLDLRGLPRPHSSHVHPGSILGYLK